MAGYWPSSFFVCLWTELELRSINSQKKERGQYQVILTSRLVNKPYNIPILYSFLCPGLSVSVILGGLDYNNYLGKLLSFLDPVLLSPGRDRFVRCWHATTDGWASTTFHGNCDGKGPTVTIIKVNDHIFGGYTDVSWHSKYHSTTTILMQML